nr:hypothetical protein [Bradyrhizobium australafricanum]
MTSPKGRQFLLLAKALHGNLFDGHTLGLVIADMEKLTGVETRRIHATKCHHGHKHPHRLRVWISGQVRRVTASIRCEMKRRAAIEPVISYVKGDADAIERGLGRSPGGVRDARLDQQITVDLLVEHEVERGVGGDAAVPIMLALDDDGR